MKTLAFYLTIASILSLACFGNENSRIEVINDSDYPVMFRDIQYRGLLFQGHHNSPWFNPHKGKETWDVGQKHIRDGAEGHVCLLSGNEHCDGSKFNFDYSRPVYINNWRPFSESKAITVKISPIWGRPGSFYVYTTQSYPIIREIVTSNFTKFDIGHFRASDKYGTITLITNKEEGFYHVDVPMPSSHTVSTMVANFLVAPPLGVNDIMEVRAGWIAQSEPTSPFKWEGNQATAQYKDQATIVLDKSRAEDGILDIFIKPSTK